MANEKYNINLDKLGTVHRKEGKVYLEIAQDVEVFEGQKGNYVGLVRFENDVLDQFGHSSSLVVSRPKDSQAPKRYIGNGKPMTQNNAPAQSVAPAQNSGGGSDVPW